MKHVNIYAALAAIALLLFVYSVIAILNKKDKMHSSIDDSENKRQSPAEKFTHQELDWINHMASFLVRDNPGVAFTAQEVAEKLEGQKIDEVIAFYESPKFLHQMKETSIVTIGEKEVGSEKKIFYFFNDKPEQIT